MTKYQKRPVVVDAFQWDPAMTPESYPAWAQEAIAQRTLFFINLGTDAAGAKVQLSSGRLASAYAGDWIAREEKGDQTLYTIDAKTFERLYEPVG